MADGITIKKTPWDYETSVENSKRLMSDVKRCTLELVRELHAAHKALSLSGYRSDLPHDKNSIPSALNADLGTNVPRLRPLIEASHTWEQYCDDIGIVKRTANRWLKLYLPAEDRMLTAEELRRQIDGQYQEGKRQILAHAGDSDWRPDNWPKAFESRYQEETRLQLAIQKEYASAFAGPQMWLFDEPYLRRLSERVAGYNEDLVEYRSFCERVEPTACPDVPVQKQVNVYKLVKAAVEDFAPAVRRDVARFVAQTLLRDASGEFDE